MFDRLDQPEAAAAYALLVELRREALLQHVADILAPEPRSYVRSCSLDSGARHVATAIAHHVADGADLLIVEPLRASGPVPPINHAFHEAEMAAHERLRAVVLAAREAVARGAAEMAVAGVEVES